MNRGESDRLRSLNRRLADAARAEGRPSQRVRRGLAFQRILARVADHGWVLKGGYCLEVRLPAQARATKDIDFVRRGESTSEVEFLDEVDALLSAPVADDGFSFEAMSASMVRTPEDPAPAWRVKVHSRVDGRLFEPLTLDVVSQFDEVDGAVEPLVVVPPVAAPGIGPVTIHAVDVYQHAAEKYHAMARLYAGDRPSSRVKDLVDLVLLAEAGLLTDVAALGERIRAVHHLRDGVSPPLELPPPPRDWGPRYERLVAELDTGPLSLEVAFEHVAALRRRALDG